MHEQRVFNAAERQSDARIKKRGIDAVGVHVRDALVRVEPAGLAVLVGHRIVAHDAIASANRAERSKALAPAKRLALDTQPLLTILIYKKPRRPITKTRIDVVLPQIQRLEDMAVGIDDIIR